MDAKRNKYYRLSVDLTDKEYKRLRVKVERIGATHAGFVRKLINRATKDIPILDTPSEGKVTQI